jgi:hypothetical protein
MKEGSLFYFVVMRSTEPGCLTSCSWWHGKLCTALAGVHGLGSMTFGLAVEKFSNVERFLD